MADGIGSILVASFLDVLISYYVQVHT
jgi:hypothetical protein